MNPRGYFNRTILHVSKFNVSVLEITPMQLRVAQVGWAMESNKVSKQKKIVMLPVHNETRCTCECMNRLEGCNRFQVSQCCLFSSAEVVFVIRT